MSQSSKSKAEVLRKEAKKLLEQAQAIDGLKPSIVMHEHEYGVSGYIGWFEEGVSEAKVASALGIKFEEDRGESLLIENEVTLDELTGAMASKS